MTVKGVRKLTGLLLFWRRTGFLENWRGRPRHKKCLADYLA
jgi:hypothetical protein